MSKILLDARSGDNNAQDTDLALRLVRGYSEEIGGEWVRPMRDLYENYELGGDYLYITERDGSLIDKGKRRLLDQFEEIVSFGGDKYYLTGERRGFKILEINNVAFVESDFEVYYGGTKIRALDGRVIFNILVEYIGVSFCVSRNDEVRERYSWVGGTWKLKNGGSTEKLGIGHSTSDDIVLGSGVVTLGTDPSDLGGERYEIGGDLLPIVDESTLSEYVFGVEVGVVGDGTGLVRWNDAVSLGRDVYFTGSNFPRDGEGGLSYFQVLDPEVYEYFISPIPHYYESPKIRLGFEGYLDVELFEDDVSLEAWYGSGNLKGSKVGISLSSGRLLSMWSNLRYEGLVLGIGVGVLDYLDFESHRQNIGICTLERSGLSYLPDGSGLVPTGVGTGLEPNGSGLVKDLELLGSSFISVGGGSLLRIVQVSKLPENFFGFEDLRGDRAYFFNGGIYMSEGVLSVAKSRQSKEHGSFPLFSLIQAMVQAKSFRDLELVSHRKVKGSGGGRFTLSNGNVVEYTNEGLVSGSSLVRISASGHLIVDTSGGVEITYPPSSDEYVEGLKNISLSPFSHFSGLSLSLTGKSTKVFESLENEEVGKIQEMIFNFLDFTPRTDFKGFDVDKFFRVGLKNLEDGVDILHLFSEKKIEWIENKTLTKRVKIPESHLFLSSGLKPNTTSIELKNGSAVETLSEGVDYDLPLGGQMGVARLKAELGEEIAKGYVSNLNGAGEFGISGTGRVGDYFYLNKDKVYRKITQVSPLKVESVDTLNSAGVRTEVPLGEEDHGVWKIFRGWDSDPDPTRLCDESFISVPPLEGGFLSVRKLYKFTVDVPLASAHPSSSLMLKSVTDNLIPIVVLTPIEIDNNTIDTSNSHYISDSYEILVEGVVQVVGVDYNIVEGVISFVGVVSPSSEVLFSPLPRVLADKAEVLSDGTGLQVPIDFGVARYLVEEVSEQEYSYQAATGAISFRRPLRRGVGVEVSYFPLSGDGSVGARTEETIAFIQNSQPATRISEREYSYNSEGFDIFLDVEPVFYSGSLPVGYGGGTTPNFTQDSILLPEGIPEDSLVMLSFATSSATGGEYVVKTTSSIYVPVIEIAKDSDKVVLPYVDTEISVGHILDLGTHSFSVSNAFNNGIQTTVEITPSARFDLRGELYRTTNKNIFIEVQNTIISCEPRSSEFLVMGDLTSSLVEDSILIIDDTPYRVKLSTLLQNGVTKVEIQGYSNGHQATTYKYSIRPVYKEGSQTLKPIGGLIPEDGFTLIKEIAGFGISLVNNEDYILDTQSGRVTLKNGHTINRDTRYVLLHTAITTLSPQVGTDGRISYPKYTATFQESNVPDKYVGNTLFTSCVIENPDTFYLEAVDEDTYVSEVSAKLLNQASRTSGGRRASFSFSNGVSFGLYETLGKDVVARNRIGFYNGLIEPIDDIISTVSGKVVGDQDGKFKFNLNFGGTWGGAGLEDPITREIQPRYLTLEFYANTPNPPLTPSSTLPGTSAGNNTIRNQMRFLDNEIDDVVMTGVREKIEYLILPPFYDVKYFPVYQGMYEPSRVSRLFPEEVQFMTTLAPSEIGRYTAGHEVLVNPSDKSLFAKTREVVTKGSAIGRTQNPAYGLIKNVSAISKLTKRKARFRVWDYSPTGFLEIPDYPVAHLGKPAIILSAMDFSDFPVTEFGYPDIDALIAQDTDPNAIKYPTVERGNFNLKYTGLSVGDKIEIGRPLEGFSPVVNIAEIVTAENALEETIYSPVFASIVAIWGGCVIILSGNASSLFYFGNSFNQRPPKRGDTLVESFRNNIDGSSSSSRSYEVGENLGIKSNTGELLDITLPSDQDLMLLNPFEIHSFGVKEFFKQITPSPLMNLEGRVGFASALREPFKYPALEGQKINDSGDYTLPYISEPAERDLLPQIASEIRKIISTKVNDVYVYPDELRLEGTTVLGDIESDVSLTPYTEDDTLPSVNVRNGDLLVVDLEENNSATGFVEISGVDVDNDRIIAPRFTSPISDGSFIKYDLVNYFHADRDNTDIGISIKQDYLNLVNHYVITIKLSSVNAGLKHSELFQFVQNSTFGASFLNRFKLKDIGASLSIEFQFENGSWYVGVGTVARQLVNSFTSVDDYTFQFIIQDPLLDHNQWGGLYTYYTTNQGLDVFSFWDVNNINNMNGNFDFVGIDDKGVDFKSDVLFSDGVYYDNIGQQQSVGASYSLEILEDRVTLKETNPAFTNLFLQFDGDTTPTELNIYDVEVFMFSGGAASSFFSKMNSHSFLNDGDPFVLKRINNTDEYVVHSLRYKNTYATLSGKKMSVWSGSEVYKNQSSEGTIFNGECELGFIEYDGVSISLKAHKLNLLKTSVDTSNVVNGDLAFVEEGHHAGVYRVLDTIGADLTDVPKTLSVGAGAIKPLPTISSLDLVTNTIVFSGDISDFYHTLQAGSKIGVIISNANIRVEPLVSIDTLESSALILDFVSYNNITYTLTFDPANSTYLGSTTPFAGNHEDVLSVGQSITGINKIPISSYEALGFSNSGKIPVEINVEGIEVQSSFGGGVSGTIGSVQFPITPVYDGEGFLTHISFETVFNNCVVIQVAHYPFVGYLDDTVTLISRGLFLLTGDQITLKYSVVAGIYTDNSFPTMGTRNYTDTDTHYFSTAFGFGMRNTLPTVTSSLAATGDYSEKSNVVVRRLRRFTPAFFNFSSAFKSLNLLYEERRGIVASIDKDNSPPNLITLVSSPVDRELVSDPNKGTATQIGNFTDDGVLKQGDYVKVFDSNSEEILYLKVIDFTATEITCKYINGVIPSVISNHTFMLEVKRHIIPQMQSFNSFVDTALTDIYTSETGQVDLIANELYLTDPNEDFSNVSVNDYILIDPANFLVGTNSEYGAPRRGDIGQQGTLVYDDSNDPSPFDDNRGVYKVNNIDTNAGTISVIPVSTYAGVAPSDYNLIPTIDGVDGAGLRETRSIVNGTHADQSNIDFSIAPFTYRVLRRIQEVDEDLVETTLFLRERTLSWSEKMLTYGRLKPSTWVLYESEEYIQTIGLGDPTHPSNQELVSIEGRVEDQPIDVPFVTSFECLSVLDRRFLTEDVKVFTEGYGLYYGSPNENIGIPTLLDNGISFMDAREIRYSWINVRVNRLNGTLVEASRVDFSNPSRSALKDLK